MCYEPLLKTVCLWRAPPFGQNSDLPGCTWSGAVGAGLNHFRTSSMRQTGSYGSDPTDTVCTAASWGAEREAGQRGRRQQRKETSGLVWERHLSVAAVSDPDQIPQLQNPPSALHCQTGTSPHCHGGLLSNQSTFFWFSAALVSRCLWLLLSVLAAQTEAATDSRLYKPVQGGGTNELTWSSCLTCAWSKITVFPPRHLCKPSLVNRPLPPLSVCQCLWLTHSAIPENYFLFIFLACGCCESSLTSLKGRCGISICFCTSCFVCFFNLMHFFSLHSSSLLFNWK